MAEYYKKKSKVKIYADYIRAYREYLMDAVNYRKYSMLSNDDVSSLEYLIMLRMHGLEKGFCMKDKRPFGQKKIVALLQLLERAKNENKLSTGYYMALGIIKEWVAVFEEYQWTDDETYKKVKDLDIFKDDKSIKAGSIIFSDEDVNDVLKNNSFADICNSRHSIRQFSEKKLDEKTINECIDLANRAPSACNRQMTKVYWIRNEENKKVLENVGLGFSGFSMETVNLFVLTYSVNAFNFYGERNQGFFNAGLFAMNLIYSLHSRGIGSCCLQWGRPYKEEKRIKKLLGIPKNEKMVVVLGAGYYLDENIVPNSYRKEYTEILKVR